MVGGLSTQEPAEDLGIETTADWVEMSGHKQTDNRPISDGADCPIGDTGTPLPPEPILESQATPTPIVGTTQNVAMPHDASDLKKLSDEQVREISNNLYGGSAGNTQEYLSEDEKMKLLQDLDNARTSDSREPVKKGFDNTPIIPPKKNKPLDAENDQPFTPPPPTPESQPEEPAPRTPRRGRGVAFFTHRFIRIAGGQELRENDEMTINGREYILKKRVFSTKLIAGIATPVAALLVFWISTMFSSSAETGAGKIIGIVLDEYHQPLISGAEIRLPDLGQSFESNAQGFFKTDRVEAGSHRIEFVVDGQVVATDYATVVDGKVTTLSLSPQEVSETAEATARVEKTRAVAKAEPAPPPQKSSSASKVEPPQNAVSATSTSDSKKSTPSKKSAPKYADVTLAANVDGARLSIDGTILGAGNLKYSKLAPGNHRYTVSKDGYQTAKGSVNLKAGETNKLEVTLIAQSTEQKRAQYNETDFFYAAYDLLEGGDYQAAVADFNEAIRLKPSYVDAYNARALAFSALGQNDAAHNDYVRAAEILTMKGNSNEAITAYNKALELDDKSIAAYLGRGDVYLSRGEDIAAIADFDMAVRLDKRNAHAYMGLGKARYNQGYYEKATKHFKDARSVNENNPEAHLYLMLSYLGDGKTKDVRKTYEKFVKGATDAERQRLESDPRFGTVAGFVDED